MTTTTDPEVAKSQASWRVGLLIGGACMAVGAIVETIGVIVTPDVSTQTGPSHVLDAIAANPTGMKVAAYFGVLLPALMVPGMIAALGLAPAAGRNLIYVGTCLTFIGLLGHAVIAMTPLAFVPMVAPGTDRHEMVKLVDPIASLVFPVAVPLLILAFLGLLVFVVGLWRAKWAPTWILGVYVAFFVLASPVGQSLSRMPLILVRELPFVLVLAWIGIKMARMGLPNVH